MGFQVQRDFNKHKYPHRTRTGGFALRAKKKFTLPSRFAFHLDKMGLVSRDVKYNNNSNDKVNVGVGNVVRVTSGQKNYTYAVTFSRVSF